MNKRSAMIVAAGLVFTLLVGAVALATGLAGPSPSAAAGPKVHLKHRKAPKPIIRTTKRTVKVHRKANTPAPVVVTVPTNTQSTYGSQSGPTYSSGSSSGGSTYGDDGGEGSDESGTHGGGTGDGSGGGDD
jgi:hypothetical protein